LLLGGRSPFLAGFLALADDGGLRGGDLLFDLELSTVNDLHHQLIWLVEDSHALGHREVGDAKLGLNILQRREVDFERFWDVGRKAFHPHCVDRLEDVGVPTLDCSGLADEVYRHLDCDLLFKAHLVEVDVDWAQAAWMGLDLADQHLLVAGAIDQEVDKVRAPRLDEHLLELEAVQDEWRRRGVVPVNDSGKLALAVKPAGTFAEKRAG
jgi:hypothetical protein